ncbi:MAG: PA2779 family protein [Deltaproteobacteria bacterium]|nr:PA2779 family protein [Deltaproteobacteria bacterium]
MQSLLQRKRIVSMMLLITFICVTTGVSPVQGGLIPTSQFLKKEESASQRARLNAFLEREQVQRELEAWGLDRDTARTRANSLTDREVGQLVQKLDQLPAGGDGVVAVTFILVLVFVILLATDIAGYTDIFPFVTKHP